MRVSRLSVIGVAALVASLLTPVAPALADPAPPSVAITGPADGATVPNPFTVTATGTLDPAAADNAVSLVLSVDSLPDLLGATDCTAQADPNNCTGSFPVDSSSWAPGSAHTLMVEFNTANEGFVDSTVITVHAPVAPTVSFSPFQTPLDGPVSIDLTGNTDPVSTDTPKSVQLDWGGTSLTQNCPTPLTHACPLTFQWDTTGLNETHDLTATMTTEDGDHATSTSPGIEALNPDPTVTITAPDPGSEHSGPVTVTATGSVEGHQTDFAKKLALYVGSGTTPVDTVDCNTTLRDCTGSMTWDSTGRPDGNYTLKVKFTSTRNRSASDSVQVHVTNPDPTAVITSPAAGDTVFGADVQVHAVGTVDPSQTDTGKRMDLYVSGHLEDSSDCPASRSCPVVLHWDASGINGNRDLKVVFTTQTTNVSSAITTVKVTTTPPSASVSSPVNGATVSGLVSVVTNGTINAAQNDTPASMQLLVDGVAVSAAQRCAGTPASPKACSLTYSWDSTGLSGQHTLQAKFLTTKGFNAFGPVVTVTVVSPVPSAAIVSPALKSTVHRTATITVTGAVDPSQIDAPASVQLSVDGVPLGSALPCTPATAGARTCSASYTWTTTGLVGLHVLAATLTTARGRVGTSSAFPVYVYGGTKTALTAVKTQHYGKLVRVTGRVTALANRGAVAGVKVKVLLVPVSGHAKALYVRTNARGFFSVAFKPTRNTTVQATLVPPGYYGVSHTFTKVKVVPRAVCSVGRTVRHSRLDTGSCAIPNLPKGTKLTLQYALKGHWYTIGVGQSHGTTVPFSFRLAARGNYLIRVVLGASKVFAASTTPSLKVTVT